MCVKTLEEVPLSKIVSKMHRQQRRLESLSVRLHQAHSIPLVASGIDRAATMTAEQRRRHALKFLSKERGPVKFTTIGPQDPKDPTTTVTEVYAHVETQCACSITTAQRTMIETLIAPNARNILLASTWPTGEVSLSKRASTCAIPRGKPESYSRNRRT